MNREIVNVKILELNDSNDLYMTLNVLLLTSETNKNGAKFLPDFIHEVVENKEFYTGLPLVAERQKLENKKYKSLGHAMRKDGTFATEQIGSYVDFYENEVAGVWELYGTVRIFKRYENVCNAIMELFNENILFFSVEVMVGNYKRISRKEREIGADESNKLFGDCIVSFPAEVKSRAFTLVAEALNSDIGGEDLENTCEKFFENATIHFENLELDLTQLQTKVYTQCMDRLGEEFYKYTVSDFNINSIVLFNYNSGDYFKMDFNIAGNEVSLSDMYKVTKGYTPSKDMSMMPKDDEMPMKPKDMPDEDDMPMTSKDMPMKPEDMPEDDEMPMKPKKDDMPMKNDIENSEQEVGLMELKEKLEIAENRVKELENTITDKDAVVAEMDAKIAELNENINTLSETVVLKDNEIAELQIAKDELDKINLEKAEAEKVEKIKDMTEKYSKLLDGTVMASEEVVEALNSLNESILQAKVVESALEKAEIARTVTTPKSEMVTSSRIVDDIDVNGSDVVTKYVTLNK